MADTPANRSIERARAPHPGTEPAGAGVAEPSPTRYAWLSILAALTTIVLKGGAYGVTGSVGLLSDALESLVNLAAAGVALFALSVAARPADVEHAYGHTKAEYFSSGFEGALILAAAAGILWAAALRLLEPRPIEAVGVGLAISVVASGINFIVARLLIRAGRRQGSIALEADANHLMSDVWTSLGVILGVGAAALTGWNWLDPLLAIAVALNIVRIGVGLIRRSVLGLLDTALPEEMLEAIGAVLADYADRGIAFHALRTRRAGRRHFISFHVLVPGDWTVDRGQDLLEEIESRIRAAVPGSTVFTHLEAIEDPRSWADIRLDRDGGAPA
ncbi:MAG TPA: cation diffusion facilitator family transporter [Longimicrobiales bacterium]